MSSAAPQGCRVIAKRSQLRSRSSSAKARDPALSHLRSHHAASTSRAFSSSSLSQPASSSISPAKSASQRRHRRGEVFYFSTSAARGQSLGRAVRLGLVPGARRGPGYCPRFTASVQGAGGRGTATGEPPQMGTSGSQRRGFRRARAGADGVPAVGGRGGVLVPGPFRCLGSSGVVWRATQIR
jgi:hypothetical protein